MNTFYVYIMTNKSRTLYVGVTGNIEARVRQHRNKECPGFTARYNVTRLAFHESFANVTDAIIWEKRIKGWTRIKKIKLIEERNPLWSDLATDWFDDRRSKSGLNDGHGNSGEGSFGVPQDDNHGLTAQLVLSLGGRAMQDKQ